MCVLYPSLLFNEKQNNLYFDSLILLLLYKVSFCALS